MKKIMYVILLASLILTACGKADVKVKKTDDKKQDKTVEQEIVDEETKEQESANEEIVENIEKENPGEVVSEVSGESGGQADSGKQTSTSTAQSPSADTTQKPSMSPSTNTTEKPSTNPPTNTTQKPSTDTSTQSPSNDVTNESITDSQLKSEAETNASKYMNYYQEVLRLVNEIRTEAGVQPLTLDTTLCRAASMRAVEMDYNNIMSHTRPDGSDWWTVLDSYGASYGTCGENVAAGYRNPASVVTGWKNSPSHYENMVSPSFKKMGVGYSSAGVGDYGHYWCQLFSN